MTLSLFTGLLFFGSLTAGLLGALTGLGGGVVLVPLLTVFFHVDIRYAIGVSLISVIATSSGAAAAYVREGFSSVRIGMFLEVATTLGAILGAMALSFFGMRCWVFIGRRLSPGLPARAKGLPSSSRDKTSNDHCVQESTSVVSLKQTMEV